MADNPMMNKRAQFWGWSLACSQAFLWSATPFRRVELCGISTGRPERAAELRVEVHQLRPGDSAGVGGCGLPFMEVGGGAANLGGALRKMLPQVATDNVAVRLDAGRAVRLHSRQPYKYMLFRGSGEKRRWR